MSGIRTPTLAEIYARQGHLERACAIYEALLAERPDDASLRDRLADLRRRMAEEAVEGDRQGRVDRLRVLLNRVRARRRSA
ncbi:MAG: tetratricopeptide repeat protein [Myxococcota bacterium]